MAAVYSEVLAVPIIHCARNCIHNRNNADRCELPDIARIYLDVMCSGFRCRPLPEPVPTFDRLDTHQGRWTGKRGKVWK